MIQSINEWIEWLVDIQICCSFFSWMNGLMSDALCRLKRFGNVFFWLVDDEFFSDIPGFFFLRTVFGEFKGKNFGNFRNFFILKSKAAPKNFQLVNEKKSHLCLCWWKSQLSVLEPHRRGKSNKNVIKMDMRMTTEWQRKTKICIIFFKSQINS